MFENYVKIALRHLWKTKGFSFINVTGLAVGMTCCLLILLFVQDELSFDNFHTKGNRIFRLNKVVTPQSGGTERHAITAGAMGPAMVHDYPEVEKTVRLLPWFSDILMTVGDKSLNVRDVVIADSTFFEVFDFELVRGNPETALSSPMSIVLTEETATRFFGPVDPIGQTILGLNDFEYTVSGVIQRAPANSHLKYNALISWSSTVPGIGPLNFAWLNRWITQVTFTYLLLAPNTDYAALDAKLPEFLQTYLPEKTAQYRLYLQPLAEIHLQSTNLRYSNSLVLGSLNQVRLFSAIAALILLIACINFMNLSTARATKRAQEIGVRKVLGAYRRQLSRQFLGESVLFSILAVLLAATLVELLLPSFNAFTGKTLRFQLFQDPLLLWTTLGIALLVGVLSGIYPAMIISGFRPIETLKSSSRLGTKGAFVRKFLVTGQFAISIVLIAGTIVVHQQMRFVQEHDLGFDKDQVVILPIRDTKIGESFDAFKNELLQHANISHAAGSNSVPGMTMMSFGLRPEGKPETERWTAPAIRVDDYDLLDTYGFEMAQGRYFSPQFVTDATNAVVVNAALARSLDWDEPVGKHLDILGEVNRGTVIGVIRDFHMRSLHHAIEPMVLYMAPRWAQLSVRITGADVQGTIGFLKQKWQQFESRYPFEYDFLDQRLAQLYRSEQRLMQTFGIFSALAILIACLGLLGLAAYAAEQRTKEIGVRKVLGATIPNIFYLISKDFSKLVLLGFLLAAPLGYFGMLRWLEDFAFRIDLGPDAFLLAGLSALLIAVLTVAYQAIKAAIANPVLSLRHE